MVRPERMLEGRFFQRRMEIRFYGVVRRDDGRQQGNRDEQEDEYAPDHGDAVPEETAQGILPHAANRRAFQFLHTGCDFGGLAHSPDPP